MRNSRRLCESFNRLAAGLLLAGLLLRAFIPMGYMLNFEAAAGDAPILVLCPTGLDAETQHRLGMHHGADEHLTHHDAAPCVFAALAMLAFGMVMLALLFELRAVLVGPAPRLETPPLRSALDDTRSPRAPPLSV